MPTVAQVRDRVDAWLVGIWPTIRNRQIAYHATHGRYWQGILTHASQPDHNTGSFQDSEPDDDRLSFKIRGQNESWKDILPEITATPIPTAIFIDVYDGPSGQGFVATVIVKFRGELYKRRQNYGPEDRFTHDWRKKQDDEKWIGTPRLPDLSDPDPVDLPSDVVSGPWAGSWDV